MHVARMISVYSVACCAISAFSHISEEERQLRHPFIPIAHFLSRATLHHGHTPMSGKHVFVNGWSGLARDCLQVRDNVSGWTMRFRYFEKRARAIHPVSVLRWCHAWLGICSSVEHRGDALGRVPRMHSSGIAKGCSRILLGFCQRALQGWA